MATISKITKDLFLHSLSLDEMDLHQKAARQGLGSLSLLELNQSQRIDKKEKQFQQKVEQITKKISPELLQKTLKTGVLPAGLDEKERKNLSFVVNTITKGDFIQFATGGRLDLTGAKSSIKGAVEAGDALLKKAGVDGQIAHEGNVFYIKDSKGDYYLVGNNPAQAVSVVLDLLPAVGGIGGAIIGGATAAVPGATATLTTGDPSQAARAVAAGAGLGNIVGAGIGAAGSQAVREALEAGATGKFGFGNVYDIAQAGLGEGATAGIANTAFKLGSAGVKAAGAVGKGILGGTNFILKRIPATSRLGQSLNVHAKLATRAITRSKPVKSVGTSLQALSQKASNSYIGTAFKNGAADLGNTKAMQNFHQIAAGLESSSIGSLLLGTEGNILAKATKNIAPGQIHMDTVITDLKTEIERHVNDIKTHEMNLHQFKVDEKALQNKILGTGGNTVEASKLLNEKIGALVKKKSEAMLQRYNSLLDIEAQRLGVKAPSIAVDANFKTATENINAHAQAVENQINKEIADHQAAGRKLGLTVKQDILEQQQKNLTANQEARNALQAERAVQTRELVGQGEQGLKAIQDTHATNLERTKTELNSLLNQDGVDSQDVGEMLRTKITDRWLSQLAEEKAAYKEALRAAPGDKTVHDISNFMTSLKQGIDPSSSDAAEVTLKRLNALKFDPSKATAKDLFDVKDIVGDALGDTRNFKKSTYAHLAEKRSELATGANSIFGKSESVPVKQYQAASAARIARNDAIQAEDYANFIGEHLDTSTGKLPRNQQASQNVFDNLVSLSNKDKGFAERVLDYAKLTPEESAAIAKAHIKNTYMQHGEDATKTVKAVLKDSGDVGSLNNKVLFNLTDTPVQELDVLQNLSKLEQTKVPTRVEELPNYLRQQEDLAQTQKLGIGKLQDEMQQKALDLRKQKLNTTAADIVEKEKRMANLGTAASSTGSILQPKGTISRTLEAVNKLVPEDLQKGTGESAALFLKQLKSDPEAALKLMNKAGLSDSEKMDVANAILFPNAGDIVNVRGFKGIDVINNSLTGTPGTGGAGSAKFAPFYGKNNVNKAAIQEQVNNVLELANKQDAIKETGSALEKSTQNLDRGVARLRDEESRQARTNASALMAAANDDNWNKIQAAGTLGGLALTATNQPNDNDVPGYVIAALSGMTSPLARNTLAKVGGSVGRFAANTTRPLLNVAARESAPAVVPRLADLLGAINQPTTTPSAEQIQENPTVLRGFAQSNEAEQMMFDELKRKGLLQLGAF